MNNRYRIRNAGVHVSLLDSTLSYPDVSGDGFVLVDLEIADGCIATVTPRARMTGAAPALVSETLPSDIDMREGQVWPCFADLHAHLDKGHIWPRSQNPDGSRAGAITTVAADREAHWTETDIRRRMEFGLRCAYAHGTRAIRSHLDSAWSRPEVSWAVAQELRDTWRGKIELQLSALVPLDFYAGQAGEDLADRAAAARGILGAVVTSMPDLDKLLDRMLGLAAERDLEVDFHCDESSDATLFALPRVASAVLRCRFTRQVVCGHCCTLALQPSQSVDEALDLIARAGIGVVSLPMCNLYLQDRQPGRTPHWRGVTLVHELAARGIPVAVASDNCRDPFYGFGDHDMLEVFREAVRIEHLDRPYGAWPRAATMTPASLMRLASPGRIAAGEPADLVLCTARDFSELVSRPQSDRIVLRGGVTIDAEPPDYRELDDLVRTGGKNP